ncbi:SNF2 family N-terminal domain-containing protein [Rhodocollybia butyracea]|uniref:SNF2 family N-terminal domain-containing protein n=1 Tax=Rhodocollybia butyracea TaxID=206335 RepID=A0A9P5PQJ9_9AGAR|nr:SNF2 family N-terminal domain-containing protein [Rhodocollybia butyracea]
MASLHRLEYSKSSRAKCYGPLCKGANMAPGSLRYGKITRDTVTKSDSVEWRHWGCVTPQILVELAAVIDDTPGLRQLKQGDQTKIRMACATRRVNPEDLPPSARSITAPAAPVSTPSAVPRKRKQLASSGAASGSVAGPSAVPSASQAAVSYVMEPEEEEPLEEAIDELIVSMSTQVVGIQYYNGLVGPGEEVTLVREPTNGYDRNAIRVDNIGNTQVGHIPRNVASKLAPLMDSRAVTVEGVMINGNLSGGRPYKLDITLKIYGPNDKIAALQPRLVWATPGQRGFNNTPASSSSRTASHVPPPPRAPVLPRHAYQSARTPAELERMKKQQEKLTEDRRKAEELKNMIKSLEKVNDEGRRSSLLDTLCPNEDILTLPVHPNPPGIATGQLKVNLLKHQQQALQWCIEHEYPQLPKKEDDKPVQFWKFKKGDRNTSFYYNLATNTPQQQAPSLGRGALFADAMGLGKTLTMIALIIATKGDVPTGFSNATLVVVPLSVLSNWEKQIEDHCVGNTLTFYSYYGTARAQLDAQQLANYDVVLTTYQTVTGEHDNFNGQPAAKKKKTEKLLFDIKWKRIILDEGHTIRNPKTKMTQSVCALDGHRRWALTGTPIINSPSDLGSLLHFLRICDPLDKEDFFKRLLLRPLKNGAEEGAKLLRSLMAHVCLRRTKEMQDSNGNPLIPLPPVEMIKIPVTLSDEARALYTTIERLSSEKLQSLMDAGAMMQSNALSMLTRMRQLALHPSLIPRDYAEQLKQIDNGKDNNHLTVTPEIKQRLQTKLAQAIEECEECPICFNVPTEPKITTCFHVFCFPCIKEIISRDPKCPMDRRLLSIDDLHDPLPPTDMTQPAFHPQPDEIEESFRQAPSAKIEQLIQLLKLTPNGEKSLVFSQFTSFLDKIAEAFEEQGIPYTRFDGQMSAKRRQEAIATFSVPLTSTATQSQKSETTRSRRAARKSYEMDTGENDQNDDDGHFIAPSSDHSDFEETATTTKKDKGKAKETYGDDDSDTPFESSQTNPAVMLLSLKAGALGLNLTVANNVYLMDPWWQEGIESQAIDRVNRIGQTKDVHVYQLIAEDTVESKVLEIQERKKKLIKEAFSGVKRTETERQHREARLQELIELFGIRQQQATRAASHRA